LKPIVDREAKHVDFDVVEGEGVTGDPAEATTSRGDTVCLLCRQVVKAAYIHEAGRAGKMGARPTAVVLEAQGAGGKRYRRPTAADTEVFRAAVQRVGQLAETTIGDMPAIPD